MLKNQSYMKFHLKIGANSLNKQLIKALKKMFGDKEIEISVKEALDETDDYRFRPSTNATMVEEPLNSEDSK